METTISTKVFPTEDPEKIVSGLSSIFPSIDFKENKNQIIGWADLTKDLRPFKEELQKRSLVELLIRILEKNETTDKTFFMLNKQTAILGKVHFTEEEHVLGNVKIEIKGKTEKIKELFI